MYTYKPLFEMVYTNNKKRYEYSPDGIAIRTCQGHSISVDVDLKEIRPASKFGDLIYIDREANAEGGARRQW